MIRIAISGNIASGKSTVENILIKNGYTVYDTDKLSHEILENLKSKVLEKFKGFDIVENNKISRKKLGNLVFNNSELKLQLENIIYPELKRKIQNIFAKKQNEKFIFVSIPLVFEVGWENLFDKILFVQANDEIRLKRLMARNALSLSEAQSRMDSQINQDLKISKSDFIICNNGDTINLQKQVDEFIILLEDMEQSCGTESGKQNRRR